VEVSRWLREHGFRGRIIFLTGHAAYNPDVLAAKATGALVLEKPVESSDFFAALSG
jgi:FixJ family two-component response regulator